MHYMRYLLNHITIRERAVNERPRELIIDKGPAAVSDIDLVSILMGSGTMTQPVDTLAGAVVAAIDADGKQLTAATLQEIKGMGPAKAATIIAALELGRRFMPASRKKITYPGDAYPLLRHFGDRLQEHFLRISLNGAHEVISTSVVSIGLVNRALVHPREVFADPLKERATSIIVAHNHPSGNLIPSNEDRAITQRLKAAGEIIGISLLDHLIFSSESFYSFLEAGEL